MMDKAQWLKAWVMNKGEGGGDDPSETVPALPTITVSTEVT